MPLIYCAKDQLSVETTFFCKCCIFWKCTKQANVETYQCDYKNWTPGLKQNKRAK